RDRIGLEHQVRWHLRLNALTIRVPTIDRRDRHRIDHHRTRKRVLKACPWQYHRVLPATRDLGSNRQPKGRGLCLPGTTIARWISANIWRTSNARSENIGFRRMHRPAEWRS